MAKPPLSAKANSTMKRIANAKIRESCCFHIFIFCFLMFLPSFDKPVRLGFVRVVCAVVIESHERKSAQNRIKREKRANFSLAKHAIGLCDECTVCGRRGVVWIVLLYFRMANGNAVSLFDCFAICTRQHVNMFCILLYIPFAVCGWSELFFNNMCAVRKLCKCIKCKVQRATSGRIPILVHQFYQYSFNIFFKTNSPGV